MEQLHINMMHICCLVTKSYPTLYDSMDYSLPGSFTHEISQARILDWIAIYFSKASSQCRDWTWSSWIGRQIPYPWATSEAPWCIYLIIFNQTIQENKFKILQKQVENGAPLSLLL